MKLPFLKLFTNRVQSIRTIEVYVINRDIQQLVAQMWFIWDKDFSRTATSLTTCAPFNSLRRERVTACLVKLIYQNGHEYEYYTDRFTERMKEICSRYMEIYNKAKQMAGTTDYTSILKYMNKAEALYEQETYL